MIILVDTREQLPFEFARIPKRRAERRAGDSPFVEVELRRATLPVGDYMVSLNANPDEAAPIAIERKSKADLFQTVTRGRARFERELDRAADLGIAVHIVVECSWGELKTRAHMSAADPLAVRRSLISFSATGRAHYHAIGDRAASEQIAYRLLEFAWKAHAKRFNLE